MEILKNTITFAVTFTKDVDTNVTKVAMSCDKGINTYERIGMLEQLKTKLAIDSLFPEDEEDESK